MSSPALPDQPGSAWSRFPLDPRSSGDLRAGDADRETAREILAEAYSEGRLSQQEYEQRLESTLTAHHLGQLVPILSDVSVRVARRSSTARHLPAVPGPPAQGALRAAIFVVAVTNLIWLAVSLAAGRLQYYWPMWPALGMAITVLAAVLFKDDPHRRRRRNSP